MSLGMNIKKYRRDLGITQEELAGILCITSQAVSKWESGAGLPDVTQIVPLAQALNVTTDALFGFASENYDVKLAKKVEFEANMLRDSGEPSQGALNAAEYLDKQCDENMFNYRIMMRYVQSIAHMSRFVNKDNVYYKGLLENDQKEWNRMIKLAENRAMQVIRYSEDKELSDYCHYALAWLYWHIKDYDKGRQHIEQLPSINSNMFQETILPYYIASTSDQGMEGWHNQVRDNYQNFIRAINKQIVYSAESMMWICPIEEVEANCQWGLSIMDKFMENEKMAAFCQGFYRETSKFLVAAYLRNNEPDKAAKEWKRMLEKIDEHVAFCQRICSEENDKVVTSFGKKAADNMGSYTREWIDSKIAFMLGQLKSWSSEENFATFEKLIND